MWYKTISGDWSKVPPFTRRLSELPDAFCSVKTFYNNFDGSKMLKRIYELAPKKEWYVTGHGEPNLKEIIYVYEVDGKPVIYKKR